MSEFYIAIKDQTIPEQRFKKGLGEKEAKLLSLTFLVSHLDIDFYCNSSGLDIDIDYFL